LVSVVVVVMAWCWSFIDDSSHIDFSIDMSLL